MTKFVSNLDEDAEQDDEKHFGLFVRRNKEESDSSYSVPLNPLLPMLILLGILVMWMKFTTAFLKGRRNRCKENARRNLKSKTLWTNLEQKTPGNFSNP